MKKSARRQKQNYDKGTSEGNFAEGTFAWLFNPAKKKGVSPKLMCRWEGPYLVVNRLSDVTLRIQRKPGRKTKVVHCDRLKPYQGAPLQPWISDTDEGTQALQGKPAGDIPVDDACQVEVINRPMPAGQVEPETPEGDQESPEDMGHAGPAQESRPLDMTPLPAQARRNPLRQRRLYSVICN